jgi:hypothetical protein
MSVWPWLSRATHGPVGSGTCTLSQAKIIFFRREGHRKRQTCQITYVCPIIAAKLCVLLARLGLEKQHRYIVEFNR